MPILVKNALLFIILYYCAIDNPFVSWLSFSKMLKLIFPKTYRLSQKLKLSRWIVLGRMSYEQ